MTITATPLPEELETAMAADLAAEAAYDDAVRSGATGSIIGEKASEWSEARRRRIAAELLHDIEILP